MTSTRQSQARAIRSDAGFTLIEVVVALVLVGMIATAAIMMVTRGVQRSTYVQDAQTATTLANEAMEQARAVSASIPAGNTVTGLVQGRTQAAVQDQWAAASNPGEVETQMAWDPATAGGTAVVPLRTTHNDLNDQTYVVDTLIGTCYRLRDDTAAPCSFTGTAPPTTTHVAIVRVMVEVSWTPTGGTTCPSTGCVYRATSLVDSQGDRSWIAGAGLKAIADSGASATAGAEVAINVLANDIGEVAAHNAVEVVTAPASGSIVSIDTATGAIRYRAPGGGPQVVDFTYRFKNSTGSWSNAGRVTVTVVPAPVLAVADAPATVVRGTVATVAVLANDTWDRGAAVPTVTVTQPSTGRGSVAVAADGTVTYTSSSGWPAAGTGTTTFTYAFTDAYGQVSGSATVTMSVRVSTPVAASFTAADVPAQAATATTTVDIDVIARATDASSSATLTVVSQPAAGGGLVGTTTRSGKQVFTYKPPAVIGKYSFTYRITEGGSSNTATVSLRVVPGLSPDAYTGLVRNTLYDNQTLWRDNDVSRLYTAGAGRVRLVSASAPSGCGTISDLRSADGSFDWRTPTTRRTCVLTYTVSGADAATTDLESTSTITVEVTS